LSLYGGKWKYSCGASILKSCIYVYRFVFGPQDPGKGSKRTPAGRRTEGEAIFQQKIRRILFVALAKNGSKKFMEKAKS
jgi:hypothetical protein